MRLALPLLLALAAPARATLEDGLRLMREGRYERAVPVLQREAAGGSIEAIHQLGWAYWHAQRLEDARKAWSELLRRDPENPKWMRLMAKLEVARREFLEAEKLARRALEKAEDDPEALVTLAKALLGRERREEAGRILDGLSRRPPEETEARLGMAELLAQAGRPRQALSMLDGLIRTRPFTPGFHRSKARILKDEGRIDEARREWEILSQMKPPDPDAMLQLGWVYLRAGRLEEAHRLAELLRDIDSDSHQFLRLGANVAYERRQYLEAERLAREALRRRPDDKDSALILAKALSRLARHAEALAVIDGLLEAAPEDAGLRYAKSDLLATAGRIDEAVELLTGLVQRDPMNRSYRKRRAQILTEDDRLEPALKDWVWLADAQPPDPDALMQVGWIYLQTRRLDEAVAIGRKMLRIDPRNPRALRFLASAELERGNFTKAVELAREAWRLGPGDKDNGLTLARALLLNRHGDEGMALLKTLEKRFGDDPDVWFHIGSLFFQLGRPDDAIPYFDRLVALNVRNDLWRRERAEVYYQAGRPDVALAEWAAMADREEEPDLKSLRRLIDHHYNRKDWIAFFKRIQHHQRLAPLEALNWARVSSARLRTKDHPGALAAADEYMKLEPHSLEGWFMKAGIHESAGDWRAAEADYRAALDVNPNSRRALDGLARLAAAEGRYREALRRQTVLERVYPSEASYPWLPLRRAMWESASGFTSRALKITRRVAADRPVVVRALLYHGISPIETSDQLPARLFREQMLALKKAGYHSITVSELLAYVEGRAKLPPKPVLITFDDGRTDAFRHGDPVLEETGFKATMFVHLTGLSRYPFHAGLDDLKRWSATGRWEMQSHSGDAHVPIVVDAEGHKARYLANRRWLPEKARLETGDEFRERLERDYSETKQLLQREFPDTPIVGFAYPFGEFGQLGAVNIKEAEGINRELVARHFPLAFVQDPHGFNTTATLPNEWARFEVPRDMSAPELVEHLENGEPWLEAKVQEARLWNWLGKPGRSWDLLGRLERDANPQGGSFKAEKGLILENMGQPFVSRELYEEAARLVPESRRYPELARRAEIRHGRSLTGEFSGSSDSNGRRGTRGLTRVGTPVRRFQLLGSLGASRYSQTDFPSVEGKEGEVELRWHPSPLWNASARWGRRRFAGEDIRRDFDAWGARGYWQARPDLALRLETDDSEVGSAQGVAADVKRGLRSGTLEWSATPGFDASMSADHGTFSDGNKQWDFRLGLTRIAADWLRFGYAFWYGDSSSRRPAYWTPTGLKQHMGIVTLSNSRGPVRGSLRYGIGHGRESERTRVVQTARAALEAPVGERLTLAASAAYNRAPTYSSREADASLVVRW